MLSEESRNDLQAMKEIRNRFAHRMEIDSFDHDEIKSRCENLSLITKSVADLSPEEEEAIKAGTVAKTFARFKGSAPHMRFSGATEKLKIRERYILSALLFNMIFGSLASEVKIGHGPII
jgi:hypothetical protein